MIERSVNAASRKIEPARRADLAELTSTRGVARRAPPTRRRSPSANVREHKHAGFVQHVSAGRRHEDGASPPRSGDLLEPHGSPHQRLPRVAAVWEHTSKRGRSAAPSSVRSRLMARSKMASSPRSARERRADAAANERFDVAQLRRARCAEFASSSPHPGGALEARRSSRRSPSVNGRGVLAEAPPEPGTLCRDAGEACRGGEAQSSFIGA